MYRANVLPSSYLPPKYDATDAEHL